MAESSPSTWSRIMPWIILLLAALGLFYFVEKGCKPTAPAVDDPKELPSDQIQRDSL